MDILPTTAELPAPTRIGSGEGLGHWIIENSENWKVWRCGQRLTVADKNSKAKSSCAWRLPYGTLKSDLERLPGLVMMLKTDIMVLKKNETKWPNIRS